MKLGGGRAGERSEVLVTHAMLEVRAKLDTRPNLTGSGEDRPALTITQCTLR